jgi:hypothetical protein
LPAVEIEIGDRDATRILDRNPVFFAESTTSRAEVAQPE